MFYSLKSDCYFRKYGNIGYIVRPIVSIEEIVDEIGAVFLGQLGYEPRAIDEIVSCLAKEFENINLEELKSDAIDFYSEFVADGFLNYSESLSEFVNSGFEYATLNGKLGNNSIRTQVEESSTQFLGGFFKESPFLDTFHIELTSKCNERCVHCYIPHEAKNTDIEYDLMVNTLEQCKNMNVLTIIFSGGEPMLHPNFCEFLKRAKDFDFNVTVLSNLTMLNEEILEALTYKHASCVNVSLYSMVSEVHDKITTLKGSHQKTKENILKLIENNIPVQINCPVMKQNKNSFDDVIRWGQEHKCAVITDYLIMARADRSTDNLNNRLSESELRDVIKKFVESDVVLQSNIEQVQLNGGDTIISPEDRICGVGMSTLCMIANGNVYPCAGWQKYVCGNLKDTTLDKIWEASPQVNYLRTLRFKDFKKCLTCEDNNYCLMCMSRNSNEDSEGNLFHIPEITCKAAKIHHEVIDAYKKENGKYQ